MVWLALLLNVPGTVEQDTHHADSLCGSSLSAQWYHSLLYNRRRRFSCVLVLRITIYSAQMQKVKSSKAPNYMKSSNSVLSGEGADPVTDSLHSLEITPLVGTYKPLSKITTEVLVRVTQLTLLILLS